VGAPRKGNKEGKERGREVERNREREDWKKEGGWILPILRRVCALKTAYGAF